MADYQTDEEKVEALRAWWQENSRAVIAGVAIGVALLFGWHYYQQHELHHAKEASYLFEVFQAANDKGNLDEVRQLLAQLDDDYANTSYVDLARLNAAALEVEKGELATAKDLLQTLREKARQAEVAELASVRLIRLLIAEGELSEAQALLDETSLPVAYTSLLEELRGDLHLANQQVDEARMAYDRAILTAGSADVEFLRMKRENLGPAAEVVSDPS